MSKKLYITVGIPGSGKSTWRDAFVSANSNTIVVCPDSIRKEWFGDESCQDKGDKVFEEAFNRVKAGLNAGKDVIFDACSQSAKRRKPLVQLAKSCGAEAHAVVFNVDLALAKDRNAKRSRVVPDFVLDRMHSQWQEPSASEGFTSITQI